MKKAVIECNTVLTAKYKPIYSFPLESENIDLEVVNSFGDEWSKFDTFSEEEINQIGKMYFDIIPDFLLNKNTYAIDIGCGTGRWSKFLASKVGFIECVDPSDAIYSADELLKEVENIRLIKASVESLPFKDETFDFGMSIGVLHHIPDTQKALSDCVSKIKKGGHFYLYLYYNLDNRGQLYRLLFKFSSIFRNVISRLPKLLKSVVCDLIAFFIYLPIVLVSRMLIGIGLRQLAQKLPLYFYHEQNFMVIRNDALDRFGTKLEHRFSKLEIEQLMINAGLCNIVFSNNMPYWHALGEKK